MKRNLLIIAAVVMAVVIMALSACGNASKVDVAGEFSDKIKTIAAENSELAGYSMDSLADQGNGLYAANAIVDGKTIGAIAVKVEGDVVAKVAYSFASDGPTQREYQQAIIASAMAMDSALDYTAAKEISDDLNSLLLFGGDDINNNGFTYSGEWVDDDLITVTISK